MQYKKLHEQLETIKTQIMVTDEGKLKQLLREKLNEIGILLYEYTSPMLTAVRHGNNTEKNQSRSGKSTTNIGIINNNCPDDQRKNFDFFSSSDPKLSNLEINPLGIDNVRELNHMIQGASKTPYDFDRLNFKN